MTSFIADLQNIVTGILLLLGGVFACGAGLGILRFPDVLMRAHASTKAGTLGAGLVLAAAAVFFAEVGIVMRALATISFLMLTAPIAAHMIGRVAYHLGLPLWHATVVDQLGRQEDPEDKTD